MKCLRVVWVCFWRGPQRNSCRDVNLRFWFQCFRWFPQQFPSASWVSAPSSCPRPWDGRRLPFLIFQPAMVISFIISVSNQILYSWEIYQSAVRIAICGAKTMTIKWKPCTVFTKTTIPSLSTEKPAYNFSNNLKPKSKLAMSSSGRILTKGNLSSIRCTMRKSLWR